MFFAKALLFGALAASAAAQSAVLTFTRVPNPITDGEPQAILYATNDTSSPVTIILRKGNPNDLQTVDVLTNDATNGQYIWTPPKSLPNGYDYALEIRQAGQVNYFGPFAVQGASYASVSASATSKNSTMSVTRGTAASIGTGTTMHRNTTMSHPTLTKSKHTTTTSTKPVRTTGAGFQGTQTSSPSPTGGASSDFSTSSSLALVLGALAAILYLH